MAKETGQPVMELSEASQQEIQTLFEAEVKAIQKAVEDKAGGSDESRARDLKMTLFNLLTRKKSHDAREKNLPFIVLGAMGVAALAGAAPSIGVPEGAAATVMGLCATTFVWVAYQIVSVRLVAFRQAASPKPLQSQHPAIELNDVKSATIGKIEKIDIRIAAAKHLLAVQSRL
jgi:hypothetical protein